jgi:hypothetical protein
MKMIVQARDLLIVKKKKKKRRRAVNRDQAIGSVPMCQNGTALRASHGLGGYLFVLDSSMAFDVNTAIFFKPPPSNASCKFFVDVVSSYNFPTLVAEVYN